MTKNETFGAGANSSEFARLSEVQEKALQHSLDAVTAFGTALQAGRILIQQAVPRENTSPDGNNIVSFRFPTRPSPLKTLDALAQRLDTLIEKNAELADELQPMSNELSELRHDIAELFQELKTGNLSAASAYAAHTLAAHKRDEATDARLQILEKRVDNPHVSPGSEKPDDPTQSR